LVRAAIERELKNGAKATIALTRTIARASAAPSEFQSG
jgi:hypothetical protein